MGEMVASVELENTTGRDIASEGLRGRSTILHAFDTSNAGIAEGLIWTAIAASVLKRYLAQMTQALRGVEVSTRKVAMCARHGLGDVFRALACGRRRGFLPVLRGLVDYLANNATRSHPKRDRKKGRLQFGLEPIL